MTPPPQVVARAVAESLKSPCRSKRGVVIFAAGEVISAGFNHKPLGFPCDGSARCKLTCSVEAVHAEQHAIILAAPAIIDGADLLHAKTVGGELVRSSGPSCVHCSKLSLVAGVVGVWLFHDAGWRRYGMGEFHALSLAAFHRPHA